jgi:hypothetical protein
LALHRGGPSFQRLSNTSGKMPQAPAFNVPPRQHLAKMFRQDLAETRKA